VRRLLAPLLLVTGASALAAQSAAPPFSCADTLGASLGAFAGEWNVQALFRAGASAVDTTSATASITTDLDGCLLREEYRGTRYREPYASLAYWGANGPDGARIQRIFAHAGHGILSLSSGGWVGDTLVLEDSFMLRGERVRQQVRVSRPARSGFTLVGRRSTDDGASWTVTLDARYTPRARR